MERLTSEESYCSFIKCDYAGNCRMESTCCDKLVHDRLKEYEDLEEHGLLLELPCEVGTDIWIISTQHDNYDENPYKIVTRTTFRLDMLDCVGKNVFLTKAEAEKALAEMEK